MASLTEVLFRKKSVDPDLHTPHLKRVLGPVQLTLLGIGAIIGTGIFVLTGEAAVGTETRLGAGPAIVLSYILTGFACALAALCYAEFAAMVPVSGSAYTYAYASAGELMAWIIGWDLILEYAVGNIGVAIGWSSYMQTLMHYGGLELPAWMAIDPMSVHQILAAKGPISPELLELARQANATAPHLGIPIIFNLPAFIVVFLVTVLLLIGARESAWANAILVLLKLVLIGLFVIVGMKHVDFSTHWSTFAPNGFSGILTGSAIIFFAYIGFDAVSTTAEECKNPQRDVPIGMIASLVVCTILYIAVAGVLTGMVPLADLANAKPVAAALESVGEHNVAKIISLGAVLSISSVLLVLQYGQSRIMYAMSRDGLLPGFLARTGKRFKTPIWATIVSGIMVAIPAAFVDISFAAELTNIGTLFAFVLVAIGILILRYEQPDARRPFRVPAVHFVAPGCVIVCLALIYGLPSVTWWRFIIWMVIGVVLYFAFVVPRRLASQKENDATSST